MNFNYNVLNADEKIIFALRSLYYKYGYMQYKMSKFEEYDLYGKNKDFLVSDSVITFTDIDGKLMALKPDVTLSIIKNVNEKQGKIEKLCYNENVYRVQKGGNSFKEIMQVGLECIGDIDYWSIGEVLLLAAKSLNTISQDFILDISHLGITAYLCDKISENNAIKQNIIKCIAEKNLHGIAEICRENKLCCDTADALTELISLYGTADEVLPKVKNIAERAGANEAFYELSNALQVFEKSDLKEKIRIDFSVISDMNYYNGVVFNGFINGVPGSVLSGGQYGNLMRKMGRKSEAIGFAVYLDMLERLQTNETQFDVDIMLLYSDNIKASDLQAVTENIIADKKSVFAARSLGGIKYRELWKLENGEVKVLENNA